MSEHKDDLWEIRSALRRQQSEGQQAAAHPQGGVGQYLSGPAALVAGELEWRLRQNEVLSETDLEQLQQVFSQTREEVTLPVDR